MQGKQKRVAPVMNRGYSLVFQLFSGSDLLFRMYPREDRPHLKSVFKRTMDQVSFPFHLQGLATARKVAGRSFLSSAL